MIKAALLQKEVGTKDHLLRSNFLVENAPKPELLAKGQTHQRRASAGWGGTRSDHLELLLTSS